MSGETEDRLRDGLERIEQWASAYPIDIFPEPDLDLVNEILADHGHLNQMDRMHASWARHIVAGIGEIAKDAMQSSGRSRGGGE